MSPRRSAQPPAPNEKRLRELDGHIKEASNLRREYEDKLRRSSDPKEQTECRARIADQKKLLASYQREYARLTQGAPSPARQGKAIPPFPEDWIDRLPHPIAVACADFNQAADVTARFLALDHLLLATVKYLAAVALAQYRQEQPHSPQLRPWLDSLSQRHLSDWHKLLDEIGAHYDTHPGAGAAIVAGLFDPYARRLDGGSALATLCDELGMRLQEAAAGPDATVSQAMERLVRYRGHTWAAGVTHLAAAFKQELLPLLRQSLEELLTTFAFIQDCPLRFAEAVHSAGQGWTYDMIDWRGPGETEVHGAPWLAPASSPHPPFKARRLYLCNRQGMPLVNLHPVLIHYQGHLWFLENFAEDERLAFRPCHGGAIVNVPDGHIASLASILAVTAEEADAGILLDGIEANLAQDDTPAPLALEKLLGAVSDEAVACLQVALGEALRIGHFWLGLEFLLMGLSKQESGALSGLLTEIGIEPGHLSGALRGLVGVRSEKDRTWRQRDARTVGAAAWGGLKEFDPATLATDYAAGQAPQAGVTPRMMAVLREAVRLAGDGQAGPDHLLLAAMQHPHSAAVHLLLAHVQQTGTDPAQWWAELQRRAGAGTPGTPGDAAQPPSGVGVGFGPRPPAQPPTQGKGVLGQLGRDLTALAQAGQLRPAIGEAARKAMAQMGEVLLQTQGNNPLLLGDPGVGKTAIVEGFAWRLATEETVVAALKGRRIVDLPSAALMAGTKYRGDLEERLQQVLAEVQAAGGQTIVFIDEIHTILGGGSEGGLGAISHALKPALARGEFPCIGATTVAEYRRHIESDPALARRFTPVWIEEPSPEEAFAIAKAVAQEHLAPRHGVAYRDETVQEAVRLAVRYLHDEFLPGKAIKLLDQAGPRVILGGSLSGPKAGDTPVGSGEVTVETVRAIVAERTGIPVTRLGEAERERLKMLAARLKERVKGQDVAVRAVVDAVKRARAGVSDPRRPQGVFLFAGPTGVGKTELALALAEALFDDQDAILRLDMSEYLEKHQVARLIGAPPGYIGHEEEGQLTGRLRRRPYSVVLLDEIEKAHPDVQHMFLQLFDAGRLTDSRGRLADGRNAIFIMTTNLGARKAAGYISEPATYEQMVQEAIDAHFLPEFRNRIQRTIYFRPLDQTMLEAIFDNLFEQAAARFRTQGIFVVVDPTLKADLCQRHASSKEGARPLERAIEDEIVGPLVDMLLAGELRAGDHWEALRDLDGAVAFRKLEADQA